MTLGYRIFTLRNSLNLSQESFGELLGTTRQTVSRWETDECIPAIDKIVQMSRLFSVTTDSLLVDGITTFDAPAEGYSCGMYRSADCEIVETEKFALIFRSLTRENVLRCECYRGFRESKKLIGICEHAGTDGTSGTGSYAFSCDGNSGYDREDLFGQLGQPFDASALKRMRRMEQFHTVTPEHPLPTVTEAGVGGCLRQWFLTSRLLSDPNGLELFLSTPSVEYHFSVRQEPANHYCCASYYTMCDLGMRTGTQYFRIRHYADDSEPFCRSFCDFSESANTKFSETVSLDDKELVRVKRYTDDEIVLFQENDEFSYRRRADYAERYRAD